MINKPQDDQGRINGATQLIGLIATPISHSKSPAMHNLAFRELGLNYVYLAFEVGNETLEDVVTGFRGLNLRGWNVSMPNKTKIHEYLDELDDSAKFAGAVNTVVNNGGVLKGYNTDGMGFWKNLEEHNVAFKGKKVVQLGNGGAGTAIAMQAALEGVGELVIFNRKDEFFGDAQSNVDKINTEIPGETKASLYDIADHDALKKEIESADILVNTTGIGMKPLEGKSLIPDESFLSADLVVCDTVYSPLYTKLLEQAQNVGAQTVTGLGMMLWQGAMAFELWTGQEMPIEAIKEQLF